MRLDILGFYLKYYHMRVINAMSEFIDMPEVLSNLAPLRLFDRTVPRPQHASPLRSRWRSYDAFHIRKCHPFVVPSPYSPPCPSPHGACHALCRSVSSPRGLPPTRLRPTLRRLAAFRFSRIRVPRIQDRNFEELLRLLKFSMQYKNVVNEAIKGTAIDGQLRLAEHDDEFERLIRCFVHKVEACLLPATHIPMPPCFRRTSPVTHGL